MPLIIVYTVTFVSSLLIFNNFGIYWSSSNPSGGYIEGLKYALLGGFGNTIHAEIAAIAALLGIIRGFICMRAGVTAGVIGRLVGILSLVSSVIAIFANSVLVYLKFQSSGAGTNIYVSMLGSPIFEVGIIATLVIGFFMKSGPKPSGNQ